VLPSSSVGSKVALFEPIHGSFPEGAGKGIANPVATILSAAMMLEYLGCPEAAQDVQTAVELALKKGVATPEINRDKTLSTSEVGDFIASNI
jgi:3-isopropylmalate dehydrogenase